MSPLEASVQFRPSGPVVVLAGEADATSAAQLRELLVSQVWRGGVVSLTVDASALRFLDSASLQVLIVAAKMLREEGADLVLRNPQAAVARTVTLMGADHFMTVRGMPED
jgi:anti-anti-sigma factor